MRKRKLLKFTRNERGFKAARFRDRYDDECILQKSSLAGEDCVWLGRTNVTPKLLARDALAMGREDLLPLPGTPDRCTGWVDFPLPLEVSLHTRMHLTQEMARELGEALLRFAESGKLS